MSIKKKSAVHNYKNTATATVNNATVPISQHHRAGLQPPLASLGILRDSSGKTNATGATT